MKILKHELSQFLDQNNPIHNFDINENKSVFSKKQKIESESNLYSSFSKLNLEESFTCVSVNIQQNENCEDKNIINLQEKNNNENTSNFIALNQILSCQNNKTNSRNIILLVDLNKNLWELIKRPDLNLKKIESFKYEELLSFQELFSEDNKFLNKPSENLINIENQIEISDEEIINSLDNSVISFTKMSEMDSMKNMVKETLNNISDLY